MLRLMRGRLKVHEGCRELSNLRSARVVVSRDPEDEAGITIIRGKSRDWRGRVTCCTVTLRDYSKDA